MYMVKIKNTKYKCVCIYVYIYIYTQRETSFEVMSILFALFVPELVCGENQGLRFQFHLQSIEVEAEIGVEDTDIGRLH